MLVGGEVTEVVGQEQLVFELAGRARRDEEEAAEFGGAALSAALGYVSGYGGRATTELARQPIRYVAGEPTGSFVETQGETLPLPPNLQRPKTPHHRIIGLPVPLL